MKNSFDLSEKIIQRANGHNFVEDTNIKEFIKRLLDEIYGYPVEFILESETEANARDLLNDIASRIQKLAGDKLI